MIDSAYALACAMTEDQTTEGFLRTNAAPGTKNTAAEKAAEM